MNKINLLLGKVVILSASLVFVFGCQSNPEATNEVDTPEEVTEVVNTISNENVTFKLPSPLELYIFLKDDNVTFNGDILNSDDKLASYETTSVRAINFGIYASDLAYCTVFDKNQETFNYFKIVKDLADELGLIEGFDASMLERLDENINNSDSLYEISNDSYWNATISLESEDDLNVLPLIVAGGWIESLYIATKSLEEFSADRETIIRIADQQLILERLIEDFDSFGDNSPTKELHSKLIDLQMVFDELYENDDDTIMTEEQYINISAAVAKLRTELIS